MHAKENIQVNQSKNVLARGKPHSLAAAAPGVERRTRKARRRRRRGASINRPCL